MGEMTHVPPQRDALRETRAGMGSNRCSTKKVRKPSAASNSFPTQVTSASLASGDNTIVASTAGQPIKVWKLIASPGANADTITLKFAEAGAAQTAIISVAANGSAVIATFDGVPYALCDAGTALVANSTTTTTKLTTYFTKGA